MKRFKFFEGTSRPCPSLKSLSNKFGGILRFCHSRNRYERLDSKLEKKMIEVKQRSTSGNSKFRSINSIILRFPQFREGLHEIRDVFRQYGKFHKILILVHYFSVFLFVNSFHLWVLYIILYFFQ